MVVSRAKKVLRKESEEEGVRTPSTIPHFEVDLHVDGLEIFQNSEKPGMIAILGRVHSIAPSFASTVQPTVLDFSNPFIIGFEHGQVKASAKELMKLTIDEFKRLCPHNLEAEGREFTASLRVVIADTPMRSFLKRIIGHMGYWSCERCIQKGNTTVQINKRNMNKGYFNLGLRLTFPGYKKPVIQLSDVNAPRRIDSEFLNYIKGDDTEDNHVNGLHDLSPFIDLDFPMISGFIIDPMHTMWAGALGRRLKSFVTRKQEGKLSTLQLAKVDIRLKMIESCTPYEFNGKLRSLSKSSSKYKTHEIRRFGSLLFPVFKNVLHDHELEHIMLLPYSMLLLGGFDNKQVPHANVEKARAVLTDYVVKLISMKYPCRFTTHEILHLPDDVIRYKCGVECNSAFPFENFLRFFKIAISSGNLPVEQIRNRLIEKNKYVFPSTSDGRIITSFKEFEMEAKRMKTIHLKENAFISCSMTERFKKLVFSTFTLSNKFPNNVCILANGSIVVCIDIIEYPKESREYSIVGRKFSSVVSAFNKPYCSKDYKTYVVSKLSHQIDEWDFNLIAGKMFAVPDDFNNYRFGRVEEPRVPDILGEYSNAMWYVQPIQHTVW